MFSLETSTCTCNGLILTLLVGSPSPLTAGTAVEHVADR